VRIALVSQEYPPETAHGGIGTQTYLKAHGLSSRGHEVHVISASADDQHHETWNSDIHVIRIPGAYDRLPAQTEPVAWLTYSVEVAAAVAALHQRSPLDVVDFPEWGGEGYIHLLNQTPWSHIPTVIQLHGPLVMLAHTLGWPEIDSEIYRVGTAMEQTCLRLADAVFSSSRCSADWCTRHYGYPREPPPILHTGVDTRLFAPRNVTRESRPTIIFAGNLAATKGVGLLVEAACRLAVEFPALQLCLMGRGEANYVAELQTKARAAGRPDLLAILGYVPQQDLARHFSRAHVFAAPSVYEGGPGFVYLEAMSCGLPVVACTGSGAAEVVTPGENGLLVPPGDLESLIEGLRRLLRSREERERMGQCGREYVLAEADSEMCLRRLEGFYSSVAAGSGSVGACGARGCTA
jgi:glycosyltransferase involved in cell wall biosynthesis